MIIKSGIVIVNFNNISAITVRGTGNYINNQQLHELLAMLPGGGNVVLIRETKEKCEKGYMDIVDALIKRACFLNLDLGSIF